jgi:hypothetical protein
MANLRLCRTDFSALHCSNLRFHLSLHISKLARVELTDSLHFQFQFSNSMSISSTRRLHRGWRWRRGQSFLAICVRLQLSTAICGQRRTLCGRVCLSQSYNLVFKSRFNSFMLLPTGGNKATRDDTEILANRRSKSTECCEVFAHILPWHSLVPPNKCKVLSRVNFKSAITL